MKLTIIGGAGVRVPLLTNGLLRRDSNLAVEELSLFDVDHERAETVARIAEAMARRLGRNLRVTRPQGLDEALEGSSFVISSIRPGGIAGRIVDERVALQAGVPGQETVGPGGWALALRTIPDLVDYALRIREIAPRAWMINFTNPVGIMAEAFVREGLSDRCIGVCDTPREQFAHVSDALGIAMETAHFDYVGLNHLGWIRSILVDGNDVLEGLLASDEALERAYPVPLFPKPFLRRLGMLPTEYLYYYYSPGPAVRKTLAAEKTRGALIMELTDGLMRDVLQAGADERRILAAYDSYLARRNASYMAIETGSPMDDSRVEAARETLYQGAAGYERIALDVMEAIHNDEIRVMPVDVANNGAISDFEWETAVEVPCIIDANGARPLATGRLPRQIRDLVLRVKEYERLTVEAAWHGSASLALEALAVNPMVPTLDLAEALFHRYRAAHSPWLDYLT